MNEVVIKVIGNYSYQTSRCLGEGVYGKVYEGVEKQTKEKVAIKKIDLATFTNDKYLQNAIFSQIYLLKRFNHPNIVKFKDVLSSKNSLYIITEFCKNGDLKQVLKKKKFKEDQAFEVMRQILNGFTQLVRERIVHRDLKPANILINDGVYKIGDFGFAKYVDNFGSQMLKSCVGSPIYMAPQILERTPYTTKCDIWSIGVIFYEMTHNTPPWKAKDENQLLKAIKNVSISHILRKSILTQKSIDFLKKTLAYSEQERIGWTELFQSYGPKSEKVNESGEKTKALTRQKPRVISANSSSNLSNQYVNQNQNQNQNQNGKLVPFTNANGNISSNSLNHLNSPTTVSPQRKRNLFPQAHGHSNSNNRSQSLENKKPNQIQNVMKWRQFLLFYHYFCVQNFTNLPQMTMLMNSKIDLFTKLLLSLSLFIKNRSTFCLSMIAIHSRTHKNAQQLYKTMKQQHQSYEMIYNDIVMNLQKQGLYKSLKGEITTIVGHGEVINEDRMDKMEALLIDTAVENIKSIGQAIKVRQKERKNVGRVISKEYSNILQVLDYTIQIAVFGINRQKYNKSIEQIIDQATFQNMNSINGSTPLIKQQNGDVIYNRERKPSQQFKEKDKQKDRQWIDTIAKDSYGQTVVQKYDRMVSLLGRTTISGSLGNINF